MQGWEVLGQRITQERSRRFRTRSAFAHASGVSVRVLADLETGARGNYLDSTLAAVEACLGWAPGTCLRVVEGGRVRRDVDPLTVRLMDAWQVLSPDARAMLVQMAESAAQGR